MSLVPSFLLFPITCKGLVSIRTAIGLKGVMQFTKKIDNSLFSAEKNNDRVSQLCRYRLYEH